MLFGRKTVTEQERENQAEQRRMREYLQRNLVVEDLTEMECQFITRVQAYYNNRDSFSVQEQEELERELTNVRQTLTSARAVVEQLVRASNGQAYGENAVFAKK